MILSVGTNSYLFVIFNDGVVAKIAGATDLINSGVYIICLNFIIIQMYKIKLNQQAFLKINLK
jgi:hypothetical protein